MPNHVITRITIDKSVLDKYVKKAAGQDYLTFDFGQLVPQPKCLVKGDLQSSTTTCAEIALGLIDFASQSKMPADPMANMGAAADVLHRGNATRQLVQGPMAKDLNDEEFEIMVQTMRSYRTCGQLNWRDWNIKHWGTKSNAYSVKRVSDTVLEFETAWSAPHPVIEKLAETCGTGLKFEFSDEDTGSNVGYRIFDDMGRPIDEKNLHGTKEGMELAIEMHNEEARWDWDEEKGQYVYSEEDE